MLSQSKRFSRVVYSSPADPVSVIDPFGIVVIVAELLSLPDPFRPAIDSPVDEHAETGFGKPEGPVVGILLRQAIDPGTCNNQEGQQYFWVE
jgi:hypothetical protein